MKALIGFKAFYFLGSVSVRFWSICEMALSGKIPGVCQNRFGNSLKKGQVYFHANTNSKKALLGPL